MSKDICSMWTNLVFLFTHGLSNKNLPVGENESSAFFVEGKHGFKLYAKRSHHVYVWISSKTLFSQQLYD